MKKTMLLVCVIIFISYVLINFVRAAIISHKSISGFSPATPSSMQFSRVMPLQFPHVEMHTTSFFLQMHRRLQQSPLQLQLMNFKSSSGAIGSNVAHNHYSLMSIHSHLGPKTCSAIASSPGFVGRHEENAVQLHPLLEVEFLV